MTRIKEPLVPTEPAEKRVARPFASEWPFGHFFKWTDDMDRMFENLGWHRGVFPAAVRKELAEATWAPAVEVFEREGRFVVRAELPGLHKENMNVEIDDDRLIIRRERKEEKEEKEEHFFRNERFYGGFYRAVLLPEGVDPETAKATFKDGVLEVTMLLPAAAPKRVRKVTVNDGAAMTTGKVAA